MPPKGKCWSCGEIGFLTAKVLRNKETGSLHCVMICDRCRKYYEVECGAVIEEEHGDG